ncbi:MAG: tetratricopeptide repeat protein [Gammaproteobacteria bacterium]
MPDIKSLEQMLAVGPDTATLRFGLGKAYLDADDPASAVKQLQRALILNPEYTAAWKLCGRALAESGNTQEAVAAYEQGIRVAGKRGDRQAQKEMQVFLQRLRKMQKPQDESTEHQDEE